jgi:hypothetical protein
MKKGLADIELLPARFKVEDHPNKPSVKITDTNTGKETIVPSFAYREVSKVLNDLFG